MTRVCAICLHPAESPVEVVVDGVNMVAHAKCKESWEEEVRNSSLKVPLKP